MADLGTIGVKGLANKNLQSPQQTVGYARVIVAGGRNFFLNTGRDDSIGNPDPPSFKQGRIGVFHAFRWPVSSGSRSVSISVKYTPNEAPRPRMIVRRNPAIGVNSDVEGVAPAGTGFVTIGPLNITPTSDGVVQVDLEIRHDAMSGFANWDNVTTT